MTADPDNPLVLEILTASSTAYSYYTDEKISEVNFIHFLLKQSVLALSSTDFHVYLTKSEDSKCFCSKIRIKKIFFEAYLFLRIAIIQS